MGVSSKNYHKQGGSVFVVGGSIVPSTETQAAHIVEVAGAAGANPTQAEYADLVAKFNALLVAVENVGILAKS